MTKPSTGESSVISFVASNTYMAVELYCSFISHAAHDRSVL